MSNPTVAAIDLLASYAENGAYIKPDGIKDAITIVLEELNRAAGEIVTLREQVNQHMTSLNEAAVFSTSLIQDLQKKLSDSDGVFECKSCQCQLSSTGSICPYCGVCNIKA